VSACAQLSVEAALRIVYQPQAVFRVRPVSRCTASLAGAGLCLDAQSRPQPAIRRECRALHGDSGWRRSHGSRR
jgi:hypothetical protein